MVVITDQAEETNNNEPTENNEMSRMLDDINDSTVQLSKLVDGLREQVKGGKLNTTDGISLLDVKNQMMLSYLTNVVYLVTKRCHGRSIEGDQAIDRLVEIRTVLERTRPLEQKLKYVMEKLVKTALTGVADENDPTHFRANPDDMVDNMAESDSEDDEEDKKVAGKKSDKSGVYVPPKLAPVYFDEEESHAAKRQRQVERAKKRALESSVVAELRDEYLDTPAEVSHSNALKATITKHQRRKTQYEEDYFTRLPTLKKEKSRGRHSMTVGNIGDHLTHFEDIQVLEDEASFTGRAKGKRKSGSKPSKKKGFKKRKSR